MNRTPFSLTPIFLLIAAVCLLLAISCGQRKGANVYDTDRNPEHFPDAAVALIRDVQGENLGSAGEIMAAFIDLYDRQPALLSNEKWREVVAQLGTIFRERGEDLAKQGLKNYSEASLFFDLAASAGTDNDRLAEGKRLFGVWDRAVETGLLPRTISDEWLSNLTFTRRIDILKRFVFRDSLGREFAERYLANQLIDEALLREKAARDSMMTISRADSAFLAYLGKIKPSRLRTIASFDDPGVDLIACQMLYHADSLFAIETYFRPAAEIEENFQIALNLVRNERSQTQSPTTADFHVEFAPYPAPITWEVGKMAMAVCTLKVTDPVGRLTVSLIRKKELETTYLPVAGTGAHQVTVAPSVRMAER